MNSLLSLLLITIISDPNLQQEINYCKFNAYNFSTSKTYTFLKPINLNRECEIIFTDGDLPPGNYNISAYSAMVDPVTIKVNKLSIKSNVVKINVPLNPPTNLKIVP